MEECRLETTDMVIARFITSVRFVSSSCWTEKRARFARPNGRRGARSFSIGVNECTFFSFLSLSPREIVIVHLDSLASFLYPRPRLFRKLPFRYF